MTTETTPVRIIYGAQNIARAIKRDTRQVYHLLWNGHIPGARKIGKTWALSLDAFEAAFRQDHAKSDVAADNRTDS